MTVTTAAVGCSDGGRTDAGETGLRKALARVAATDQLRDYVEYADGEGIAVVAGRTGAPEGPWRRLRGYEGGKIAAYSRTLADVTGIELGAVRYRIAAGAPPYDVALLVGGQDAGQITGRLRASGWQDGANGELTAPSLDASGAPDVRVLSLSLAKVKPTGADLAHGSADASLDPVLAPGEKTLAADAGTVALADCLGDVIVALMTRTKDTGEGPDAVAVGVRRTADKASAPRAIVCSEWRSAGAADRAAGEQRDALASGPFADTYRNGKAERAGGNLVRLEADTPDDAAAVLAGFLERRLPGM
ncbi:hypothetical protein [Lentzea tibetensis]|uniref:hypothetical protein n=1 Tax=Lentzea tibetensis TaxID=2591470 RepID=UPI001645365B|nr:hypothetical protein [Lentzea tibetensis]